MFNSFGRFTALILILFICAAAWGKVNSKTEQVTQGANHTGSSILNQNQNHTPFAHQPEHKKFQHPLPTKRSVIKYLGPFGPTQEVESLATQIASAQSLPESWVLSRIAQARLIPSVVQLMSPAPAPIQKNWAAYRARFIEPTRIGQGVEFWRKHEATLNQAELEFGVPAEIIVGILGVETLYGQHMGAYPVLDALATLSLKFPKSHPRALERQAFFQNELGIFLKDQFLHPPPKHKEVLGSYAGAIGAAQFMPSSLAKFALDYDKDGVIDLVRSPQDAIGSIANYFKMYGWQSGAPVRFPITLNSNTEQLGELLLPDILPTFTPSALESRGVVLGESAKDYKGLLALIELENGLDAKSYLAGTENFYVVTRYNWSSYYAMAVLDLGLAVREAYLGTQIMKGPPR